MLGTGLGLTLLGIGVVIGFLIILVVIIGRIRRRNSVNNVDKDTISAQTRRVQGGVITSHITAAISAAITAYREGIRGGTISPALSSTGNSAQITAAISAAITEYRKSK